jgi:hypothetical protein
MSLPESLEALDGLVRLTLERQIKALGNWRRFATEKESGAVRKCEGWLEFQLLHEIVESNNVASYNHALREYRKHYPPDHDHRALCERLAAEGCEDKSETDSHTPDISVLLRQPELAVDLEIKMQPGSKRLLQDLLIVGHHNQHQIQDGTKAPHVAAVLWLFIAPEDEKKVERFRRTMQQHLDSIRQRLTSSREPLLCEPDDLEPRQVNPWLSYVLAGPEAAAAIARHTALRAA